MNLFDSSREKRRPIKYAELPKILVDAVLSTEDRRFFDHPGFDPVRVLGAAWVAIARSTSLGSASPSANGGRSPSTTTSTTSRCTACG